MPIVVTCPKCPTKLSAPDSAAGKQLRCPKCGALADVPQIVDAAVVEAAPAPPKPKPKPVQAEAADEDNENERPRKKKKRRSDDDEQDRPHRRRKSGGGGKVVALVLGGVFALVGIGVAVYLIAGKGSLFTKRAPVPPGWKEFKDSEAGFKAYFPEPPYGGTIRAADFRQVNEISEVRGLEGAPEIESLSHYMSGFRDDPVSVKVVVTHFKTQVPKSLQNNIRELAAQKGNHKDAQTVRWLGHDAVEYVTHEGLVRAVFTDRALVVVTISGPWGQRAKPEEEAGFFDNFELLT